jgi:hypothetical protein
VCIYYDPEQLHDMVAWGLFTINDQFAGWRSDGIIARLVYISFKVSAFPRHAIPPEEVVARARQHSAVVQTKLWLEAHDFPHLLSESFSNPPSEPSRCHETHVA